MNEANQIRRVGAAARTLYEWQRIGSDSKWESIMPTYRQQYRACAEAVLAAADAVAPPASDCCDGYEGQMAMLSQVNKDLVAHVRKLEAALNPSDKTISRWVAEFWHECRTGGGWQPDWSEIIRGAFRCARDGLPALATPTEQEWDMGCAQITGEIEFTATGELAPDKDFHIVELQRQLAETRSALLCVRRHGNAGAVLQAACEPWKLHVGEPPDNDSPLSAVFGAGMTYMAELLAKLLDVQAYEPGDGSEDFAQDAAKTLSNILTGAGLYDEETGAWATLPAVAPPAAAQDEGTDYRCVNGHDLCYGGLGAGPECPYCERTPAATDRGRCWSELDMG